VARAVGGVVLEVICRARLHDSELARAAGCVCPVGWGQPYRPPPPARPQRTYVRSQLGTQARRGPHRTTVTEPDEIAVERFVGGDRSLVLAKVERDAAIDRLDRHGMSAREVAIRLGLTQRTVQRRRTERRQERQAVTSGA
jgi:hypothetical protein